VALATWVIPRALLAADCGTAEQVGAFLDAYAEARRTMVANIRVAAIQHEAQLAATRAAFASDIPSALPLASPAPAPAPVSAPVTSAVAAVASQVAPIKKKVKARSPAVVAEAGKTLDDLFTEAVTPVPSAANSPVSVPPTSAATEGKKSP
jgi:hypothetical protein